MKYLSLKMFVLTTLYLNAFVLWNAPRAIGAGMEPHFTFGFVDSNNCDLDAPGNFHITDIGADYVSVAWNPVQGAQAYYLKAISFNSAHVGDTTVTTTNATLQLPPGGPYTLVLAAVAEGCPPSRNEAIIPDVITLVVDLIVTGRTMPESVVLLPTQQCYSEDAPDGDFWFCVKQNNVVVGVFDIELNPIKHKVYNCTIDRPVSCGKAPVNSPFIQAYIHDPNNNDIAPCAEGIIVRIKNMFQASLNLFDLNFRGSTANHLNLCVTPLTNGEGNYSYSLYKGMPGLRSSPDASAFLLKEIMPVSIRNPFTENLEIQFPEPPSGPVRFQLFDLNGAPVFDQQFPAVQQYNLPTAGLPPGFYLLRTDAAGVSRTYKVVKAR